MRYATIGVYMRKAFEAARDTHVLFGKLQSAYSMVGSQFTCAPIYRAHFTFMQFSRTAPIGTPCMRGTAERPIMGALRHSISIFLERGSTVHGRDKSSVQGSTGGRWKEQWL